MCILLHVHALPKNKCPIYMYMYNVHDCTCTCTYERVQGIVICPCGNLRKKSSKTCARNCGRKQQKMQRKVRKDAELARNRMAESQNYWQEIADLGQITKFVASLESLFAYSANNLRTGP